MITYLDKVLYLYPNINRVMYWRTQYNGAPWEDSYSGLIWENTDIPKPSKDELDALDNSTVENELKNRKETIRKRDRDEMASKDITILSNFSVYKQDHGNKTISDYLDYLEAFV